MLFRLALNLYTFSVSASRIARTTGVARLQGLSWLVDPIAARAREHMGSSWDQITVLCFTHTFTRNDTRLAYICRIKTTCEGAWEMAHWIEHWLFFERTQVQFLALTWQLSTVYNSCCKGSDTLIQTYLLKTPMYIKWK